METDWEEGLGLSVPSMFGPTYSDDLMHPVIDFLSEHEEDLMLAALGWLLAWKEKMNFYVTPGDKVGFWERPAPHKPIWDAHKERMTEWAWLDKGGLDLVAIHTILILRHHVRLGAVPARDLSTMPVSTGKTKRK